MMYIVTCTTVWLRSLVPFHIATHYMKMDDTSWTYSIYLGFVRGVLAAIELGEPG